MFEFFNDKEWVDRDDDEIEKILFSYSSKAAKNDWRDYIDELLDLAGKRYEVVPVDVPAYETKEDFVELIYMIDDVIMHFDCDWCVGFCNVAVNASDSRSAQAILDYIEMNIDKCSKCLGMQSS